jgi:hypothetical protein
VHARRDRAEVLHARARSRRERARDEAFDAVEQQVRDDARAQAARVSNWTRSAPSVGSGTVGIGVQSWGVAPATQASTRTAKLRVRPDDGTVVLVVLETSVVVVLGRVALPYWR